MYMDILNFSSNPVYLTRPRYTIALRLCFNVIVILCEFQDKLTVFLLAFPDGTV